MYYLNMVIGGAGSFYIARVGAGQPARFYWPTGPCEPHLICDHSHVWSVTNIFRWAEDSDPTAMT